MSVALECKKVKRTGFYPAFLASGLLAAAIPVLNMAVRFESYLGLSGSPMKILLDANWQIMVMLNLLMIVAGACLMYNTENSNNAMQKMKAMPIKESRIFIEKFLVMSGMLLLILAIEIISLVFCSLYWFEGYKGIWSESAQYLGYLFLITLPCVMLSLFLASVCKSMWISLGIGVVCIFMATMILSGNSFLAYFPFALPFWQPGEVQENRMIQLICAACIELIVIGITQLLFIKVRRSYE